MIWIFGWKRLFWPGTAIIKDPAVMAMMVSCGRTLSYKVWICWLPVTPGHTCPVYSVIFLP